MVFYSSATRKDADSAAVASASVLRGDVHDVKRRSLSRLRRVSVILFDFSCFSRYEER